MKGALFALAQSLLLLALLLPDGTGDGGAAIPADWVSGLGLALLYAAVLLAVMTLWARRWRARPPSPPAAETEPEWMRGPYRFVRHPMRLALLAGVLGWCLIFRSSTHLAIAATLVVVTLLDARRADRALAPAGPAVREWQGRVRAFVPGLY